MKDMSTLWTEEEARRFLGKKIKDIGGKYARCDSDGIPCLLPDQVREMKLDSPKVREALQACASAEPGDIVLIVGPGGSGKSVLFRAVAHSVPNALCLAPTGVAALNLLNGGWLDRRSYGEYGTAVPRTINSALHLPPADYLRRKEIEQCCIDQEVTHIMVDEVSMVNPNTMDALIYLSKFFRIPLLLFGDPLQLPPVEKSRTGDSTTASYPQWRFFGSYGWMLQNEDHLKCIVLDSVYRQNDPGFKSLLNRAREGMLTEADENVLRKRVSDTIPPESLVLCFKNETAATINNSRKGKNRPRVTCSSLYRYIFEEDDPFKGAVTLSWGEDSKDERFRTESHEALLLLPRENAGPDVFDWVDMKTNGRAATELATSATVMKRLELYPGDRVMITRNMKVNYVSPNFGLKLYDFLHGTDDIPFPYDGKRSDRIRVVNGTMGTYLGMCNSLASREDFYSVLDGSLSRLRYGEEVGREAARELRNSTPYPEGDPYVTGTATEEDDGVPIEPLLVRLDDGDLVLVPQVIFTATRTDSRGRVYETENVVQYPLRPAFAITYHKSQGLTLDHVHMILDPNDPMPPGLGYLGLSRCRTLEGLTLSDYVPSAFVCDKPSRNFLRKLQFMADLPPLEERKELLLLADERTEEDEPAYTVPGYRVKFRSVRRALEFANIPSASEWTLTQQEAFAALGRDEMCLLAGGDEKVAARIREEHGLPEFKLPPRRAMTGTDILWDLNRTKLHRHPKLARLLHMAGEPGKGREASIRRLTAGTGLEDTEESVSAFMELRNPRPGNGMWLEPGEYSVVYLEGLLSGGTSGRFGPSLQHPV